MAGKSMRRWVYSGRSMASVHKRCISAAPEIDQRLLTSSPAMKGTTSRSGLVAFFALTVALAADAAQFKFPGQTFTLPDGFEIEQVAGPGLVDRPISASFDEVGRLLVTDSSGSNEKPDVQLQVKPHRIVRLEDTHGDGKFDKSTVFADSMMFPEGCLWFEGALYVAAP